MTKGPAKPGLSTGPLLLLRGRVLARLSAGLLSLLAGLLVLARLLVLAGLLVLLVLLGIVGSNRDFGHKTIFQIQPGNISAQATELATM
jgi:hypothetical protein